jgi:hypothetical protein
MVHYLSFLKDPTDDRATTNNYHCCPEHEVSMVDAAVSSGLFTFIIVPLLIFCARVCDMTLDTIRVIFLSKGVKYLPPVIGFFEVIIWLVAIGQVMNTMTNVAFCSVEIMLLDAPGASPRRLGAPVAMTPYYLYTEM